MDFSRFGNKKAVLAVAGVAAVGLGAWAFRSHSPGESLSPFSTAATKQKSTVTREALAEALGDGNSFLKFPSEVSIPMGEPVATTVTPPLAPVDSREHLRAIVQYTFDAKLQESMETLFRQYSPDYGAFVAMDAVTGRVLAMVSYSRDPKVTDNLALRATFPSASVFKLVTAAAAIQERKYNPETSIQFNGANHTLYKGNILKTVVNRWSRHMSLKEAFAKSVNTVFGRIGAYTVGPEKLRQYAARFGFNRAIASDLPVHQGQAPIAHDADAWDLAQTASGYTRDNTMSPLQGALMAASVVNGGVMMQPYVVQAVFTPDGSSVYTAEPTVANVAVEPATAAEIRDLMQETVERGTSRKAFHGFAKGKFRDVEVGGKTGSLTGLDPRGKYDWFVGYAQGGGHKIAIASLTIHQKLWRVKSSYVARKAIETYFEANSLGGKNIADSRR
jgi:peptidoglycan glycosyltransferase